MSQNINLTEPTTVDESVNVTPQVVHDPEPDAVEGGRLRRGRRSASSTATSGPFATSDVQINRHEITAFIGPSGCGKTTVLRCFNRMNDLIDIARVEGKITYHGVDLYHRDVNPVEVRRRIGMVFQKPNPFPKSIYENVAVRPEGGRDEGQHGRHRRAGAHRRRRSGTR